jgi:hypothetical protein
LETHITFLSLETANLFYHTTATITRDLYMNAYSLNHSPVHFLQCKLQKEDADEVQVPRESEKSNELRVDAVVL